jgi:hypothetical protein
VRSAMPRCHATGAALGAWESRRLRGSHPELGSLVATAPHTRWWHRLEFPPSGGDRLRPVTGVIRLFHGETVRHVAHLRSEADFFPTQVGRTTFPSPFPSATPLYSLFDRFEIVWRGAPRCFVVR